MANDPGESTVKVSSDGASVNIYTGGGENEPHSHDVFHSAADGWTTHDFGRDEDGHVFVDTLEFQGNVIGGSEQYDDD